MTALWRLLKLPWLATVKSRGWWWSPLLIWATWTLILGNNAGSAHHVSWQRWGLTALVSGVFILWTYAISNTLNLRRDACALKLPHAVREANGCLLAYLLLSVALPGVVVGSIFGHMPALAIMLLLAASSALAIRLLPARVALLMLIPFAVAYILWMTGHLQIPGPGTPGFFTWAAPLAMVFSALAFGRWVALRNETDLGDSILGSPGVFNDRRVRLGRLTGHTLSSNSWSGIFRKPDGTRSRLLRDVGPQYPVRSLRAALHARIKPWGLVDKGKRSPSAQQAVALVVLGVALLVFLVERSSGRTWLLQFAPFGLMVVGIVMAGYARLFWRQLDASSHAHDRNAALLALLPNLGSPAQVKRRVLLAWLQPNIHGTLGLGLVAVMMCLLLRVPLMVYAYLALMAAGGILTCAALTANTLGGTPLRPWMMYTFYPVGVVLASLTAFWGVQGADAKPVSLHTPLVPAAICVGLWLAWLAVMVLLAWRGWRALQVRPHPFFTDAS